MIDLSIEKNKKKVARLTRDIHVNGRNIIAFTEELPDIQYAFYLSNSTKVIGKIGYNKISRCKFILPYFLDIVFVTFFYKDHLGNKLQFKTEFTSNNSVAYIDFDNCPIVISNHMCQSPKAGKPIYDILKEFEEKYKELNNAVKSSGYQELLELIRKENFSSGGLPINNTTQTLNDDSFKEILIEAEKIPDSNGSEFYQKYNYKVGMIGDIFMFNFYKDVFENVEYLSPCNYRSILDKGLDIIIYTTCWKGINNEEWKGVKYREKPKNALNAILKYAKKNDIKTVFQSIEDPSDFEYFLPLAEQFDYVLTSDEDCIDRYKEELSHNRVFYGEYGVNPQFNNPIGSRRSIRNAAFFAGSYYTRFQERCKDMESIFDSILEAGGTLCIADRNYYSTPEELRFPEKFQPYVLPPIQHDLLQKVHKLFRYNLNFNSIKQSPTMCAMRVYELQAQGNGLISNYAKSVFNKFPGVRIIPFKQNMSFDFEKKNELEEYKNNIANVREVLNNKTSYDVVSVLLNNIGLETNFIHEKTIIVFCREASKEVIESFNRQSYSHRMLLEDKGLDQWDDIKQRYNIDYFCWFDKEYSYEKEYLNDLLNGFKYTDSTYITKNAYFDKFGRYIKGEEHEYTELCSSKSLSLFSTKYIDPQNLNAYDINQSFKLENGYCIDPFEVNYASYLQHSLEKPDTYNISVIIPVYNNGKFLITKCIPSLQRNKLWSSMQLVIVDDGSTDNFTLNLLKYLDEIYPNIKLKLNHGKASGSPSRPRNQGVELAQAPLITFLDPDNEIAPSAYDLLFELYSNSDEKVNFVSGYHVIVGRSKTSIGGKHSSNKFCIIKNFKEDYFGKGKFPIVATQSALISKKFLDENNIKFVEKSFGEDTLYGWELVANSQASGFTNGAYIIYYADRDDSITNTIDKSYFEKQLILEREQVKFLKREDIFEAYKNGHLKNFVRGWYLRKLKSVCSTDYERSLELIDEICRLYDVKLESLIDK